MTYTYSIHWHCTCIFTTFIFSTFFWARQQAQYIFNLGAGFWCQRLPHSADHTPIALGSVVRAPEHVAVWTLLTLAYLPTSKGCGAEYGSETLLDHEGECPDQKIALVHPQAWAGRLRVVRCDADATVWLMRCVCDAMCVCVWVCVFACVVWGLIRRMCTTWKSCARDTSSTWTAWLQVYNVSWVMYLSSIIL